MPYCFINLRPAIEGDGLEPDFPENTSFLLIADCKSTDYGLYEYRLDEENEEWLPLNPVSEELESLIESGKRFPPALALAKNKVSKAYHSQKPTLEDFSKTFIKELNENLSNQADSGFIISQAIKDEIGYIYKSEWYWVLGISKKEPDNVHWVSSDFYIYSNPTSDFDLTEKQIKGLTRT